MIDAPIRLCGKCGAPARTRDTRCRVCNTPFPGSEPEEYTEAQIDEVAYVPTKADSEEDSWGDSVLDAEYQPRKASGARRVIGGVSSETHAPAAAAAEPRRAFLRIGFLKSLILFVVLAGLSGYVMAKWSVGHRDPVISVATPPPASSTTPSWAMLAGGPARTGQSKFVGPASPIPLWQLSLGGTIYASPVIAGDGTVYIGSTNGNLYAIAPDGKTKWVFKTSDKIVGTAAIGADGTVYVGSADKRFYALRPNGKAKWAFVTKGPILSSPLVGPDGTIYFGSSDHNLYALRPNGKAKWVFSTRREITAAPTLGDDKIIYIGSHDRSLYAIDLKGRMQWEHKIKGEIHEHAAIGPSGTIYLPYVFQVRTTGGIVPGNVIFDHSAEFRTSFPRMLSINPGNDWNWIFEANHTMGSPPAITKEERILAGSWDKKLYSVTRAGMQDWAFKTSGEFSSPITIGGDGTIYAGNRDHQLYAIGEDGKAKWSFKTSSGVYSAPAIASDGTLYAVTRAGELYALKSSK